MFLKAYENKLAASKYGQNGHLSRLFLFSFDDGTEDKNYTAL